MSDRTEGSYKKLALRDGEKFDHDQVQLTHYLIRRSTSVRLDLHYQQRWFTLNLERGQISCNLVLRFATPQQSLLHSQAWFRYGKEQ